MSSFSPLCRRALARGSCDDSSCDLNHNIPTCDPCGLIFDSEHGRTAHLNSRKHRNKMSGKSASLHCSVCDIYLSGSSWPAHVKGSKHAKKSKQQGVDPMSVQPETPEQMPGHIFCGSCARHIRSTLWGRHIISPRHKQCQRFAAYTAALDEAEQDKNDITVEGECDFQVVALDVATVGKTTEITVQCNASWSSVSLIECFLRSARGGGTRSAFTATVLGTNRAFFNRYSIIKIQVLARQAYNGRSEDRLELLFEDASLGKQFMIARTVRWIVGSQSDHDALKPSTPFKPRKRTTRQPETDVVAGEMPRSLNAIPYISKLPPARILKPLEAILATATSKNLSVEETISQIRGIGFPSILNVQSYIRQMTYLLWTEEFRMERDLEHYDMYKATLRRHNRYHFLAVPGLAEKRPSVLVGDSILVQKVGAPAGHWFQGGVHVVQKEEVGLVFQASLRPSPGDLFNVRFKLNRIMMCRQHHAVNSAFEQERVLFPNEEHILLPSVPHVGLSYYNPLIPTNGPQMQAVMSIVSSPPGSLPFVVFGPPGTGKTVTIVEAILQLIKAKPTARVLVCAPSNSAADLITERLRTDLNKTNLFRAVAPSRHRSTIPDSIIDYTFVNNDGTFSVPLMPTMRAYRVIVSTCGSASIVSGIGIPRGHYSHIFVDEAGQATEPEVMIAIKNMADNNTNIVLSGDPKQLGPVIRSAVARTLGLEKSFIERLMERGGVYDEVAKYGLSVVKLVKNFRSHNAILKFPNERFYKDELKPFGDPAVINSYLNSTHLVSPRFPIVFHAISGQDDREASSPSFFNVDEVTLVKQYVEQLRADRRVRITDNDIGIIAPYHAQCLRIRAALRATAGEVKVGSVEEFQGQERRVIIISTVRSSREFVEYDLRHTLGFVANPRRFNVAVTRAQALLIIVGDPTVLSLDPLWRSFLNYIYGQGGWKGLPPTWDTTAPVIETGDYASDIREAAEADMNDFTRRMETMTLAGLHGDRDSDIEDFVDVNIDRPNFECMTIERFIVWSLVLR